MSFENIHNYYEVMVLERLNDMINADFIDNDPVFLEDVACVALNQLPAKYVKYDVDMVFYLTPDEKERIDYDVHRAVTAAVEYVTQHRQGRAV
jgi:competence protein ComFB